MTSSGGEIVEESGPELEEIDDDGSCRNLCLLWKRGEDRDAAVGVVVAVEPIGPADIGKWKAAA